MVCFGMWWTLSDPEVRDGEDEGGGAHTVFSRHIADAICLLVT